jgi:hypothetical protein
MNNVLLPEVDSPTKRTSYIHELFDKAEEILQQHRYEDPDLYRMVEERKVIKEANEKKVINHFSMRPLEVEKASVPKLIESIYFK